MVKKTKPRPRRKFLKWFSISFLGLAVSVFVFVTFFLEDVLVDKLTRELNRTFKHYYSIDYKSMEAFMTWNGFSIRIDEPRFKSDTANHELNKLFPTLFFTSHKLEIKGISVRQLLFTDNLSLGKIKLEKPTLKVIIYDADAIDSTAQQDRKKKKKKPTTDYLDISRAEIVNGTLACSHYKDLSDTTFLGYGINASVENIGVKASRIKTLAYELTKENSFHFRVRKALWNPYRSHYVFEMDSLDMDDRKKVISAKNLSEKTFTSKLNVSRQFRYAKDIPEVTIGAFVLRGYQLKDLILQQSIVVRSITLDQTRVEIFKNRQKAINKNKEALLLNEMLLELPFSVKVDTVHLTHSSLTFDMIHQKGTPLRVSLTGMNILLTGVNTIPGSHSTMVLEGRGKFMGAANFQIRIVFPNIFKDDSSYKGYIGEMSFKTLNPLLASYSGLEITDGRIHSIVFSGRCTKYENFGSLVFKYNDLRIQKIRITDDGKSRKIPLVTLMGNIMLKNNNPRQKGEDPVRVNYHIRREKYRGHVALLFGGVMEGVKNTLMTLDMQKKTKNVQEKVKGIRFKRLRKSKKEA